MAITQAPSATELCAGGGGGSGGSGTVTSITDNWVAVPEVLTNGATTATITTSGSFVHTKVVQLANTVWAGPATAPSAVPVFRALVAADIPALPYWGLTGNAGTNPPTNFIGTTDAKDWVWKTNAIERGRLTSAGDLGIGNTAPGRLLDVGLGSTNISGGLGIARAMFQDAGGTGGRAYNVKAYGAVCDGVTNDLVAVTKAASQAYADWGIKGNPPSWGAFLEFPPGTCLLSGAVRPSGAPIVFPLGIRGSGIGVSVIKFNMPVDTVGRGFEYVLLSPALNETNPNGLFHGPQIQDVSFDAVTTNRPEYAVLVNTDVASTKPIEGTVIQNVEGNRAMHGIGLYETAATVVDHYVTRPGNYLTELELLNTTFPDAGDSTVTRCDFQSRLMPTGIQIDHLGTNGTRITNNKFNGAFAYGDGPYCHIRLRGTGGPAEVMITGNSFEGADTYAIRVEGAWTNTSQRNLIANNQIDDTAKGKGGHRISFAPTGAFGAALWQITNNNIERTGDDGATNFNCIELLATGGGTCTQFEIAGNTFKSARATDTAIATNANATGIHVGDNAYVGFTTPNSLHASATSEGITLFGSAGHVGNFIEAYRGSRTSANLKFRVDEMGQAVIRWANIGARGDQPAGFLATASINEANFIPTPAASTNALSISSPRTDGGYITISGTSDVSACAATGVKLLMGLNTAGSAPAAGTYTGNFIDCFRSVAGVTTKQFSLNASGQPFIGKNSAPSSSAAGGYLYVATDGHLHYLGSAGTDTDLATA